MEEGDRQVLLEELREGRQILLDPVAGVTEDQACRAPAPERWSILECVEHVATAESFLLRAIMHSVPKEGATEISANEAAIRANGANRSRRFEAPEPARPKARFRSLAEESAGFQSARDRPLRYVEGFQGDLRARTVQHPLRGTVTGCECMLMLVMHPIR